MLGTELRIGDTINHPQESITIMAKTSKATAIMRPKSWKKFAIRDKTKKKGEDEDANMEPELTQSEEENDSGLVDYVPLVMRTQDRKSTRLNSSHSGESRMPSSA